MKGTTINAIRQLYQPAHGVYRVGKGMYIQESSGGWEMHLDGVTARLDMPKSVLGGRKQPRYW